MRHRHHLGTSALALVASGLLALQAVRAADHNDPNSANSIFSDIQVSPADLYDLFGYPVEGASGERVFLALTFAAVPQAGVLDPDLLYRVRMYPSPRVAPRGHSESGSSTDSWALRWELTGSGTSGNPTRSWPGRVPTMSA